MVLLACACMLRGHDTDQQATSSFAQQLSVLAGDVSHVLEI